MPALIHSALACRDDAVGERSLRQCRRCLRDRRPPPSALEQEVTELDPELYAELGYDMVAGSFASPSRLLYSGRRLSASDGTAGLTDGSSYP